MMGTTRAGLVIAALALTAGACTTTTAIPNEQFDDGQVRYSVESPGEGWTEIAVENTNVAWLHEPTASAILVNSHCEGVEDAALDVLTRHLTVGMTDRQVLEEKRFTKSKREALETVVSARIDGVERKMVILVLKKDGCVYDVVYTAHPARFEKARPGYERVKGRFDVLPRADRSS